MFNSIIQFVINVNFIFVIDWILRITGFLTIVASFILLFVNHHEFNMNIFIDRINKSDINNYKNAIKYIDVDSNGEYLLFLPQGNRNFKNVRYCEYVFNGRRFKIKKILQKFKNINCENGLIINTYYPCGAPARVIEWEAEYGVKGVYIIAENGVNGDVRHGNYFYKFNLVSKLRKKVGWK